MSDSQDQNLKTTYEQLCYSYRAIDDFRAKLLGFLPLASGTGIFLLIPDNSKSPLNTFLGPVGAFGFLITLGLFFYEIYGIKKCHGLIKAGQYIEDQMRIPGQFQGRPREVAGIINEPFAAGVIYPAVLAAWTFLALQDPKISKWVTSKWELPDLLFIKLEPPDRWIAIVVFLVGFACSFAYNRWLRKERPFLAELFDSKPNKLDERSLVSHTFVGSLKSAKNWAKNNENATYIRLTAAADVEKTKTKTYGKASAQGKWKKTSNIENPPVPSVLTIQRSYYSSIENADWKLPKEGKFPNGAIHQTS
jgi:hypothetical protein